jgi:hypothetical protein
MVKSNISVLAYGLILILFIVIIFLIIMFSSKCSNKESFESKKNSKKKSRSSCGEDEFELCTMYAGSDVACGCLKNKTGSNPAYKKTNNIACGNYGNYVCNYTKYRKTSPKITCGCMQKLKKDDPTVILPEEYLK